MKHISYNSIYVEYVFPPAYQYAQDGFLLTQSKVSSGVIIDIIQANR